MFRRVNAVLLFLMVIVAIGFTSVSIRQAKATIYEGEGSCPNIIGSANCDPGSINVYTSGPWDSCHLEHVTHTDPFGTMEYYQCCQFEGRTVVCAVPGQTGVGHTVEYFKRRSIGRASCQSNGKCSAEY